MLNLSNNIAYLRGSLKLTKEKFGELFSLSRGKIETYENGSQPRLESLIAIANHFKITLDELIREDLQKKEILKEALPNYSKPPVSSQNEILLLREVIKSKDEIILAKDEHIHDMRERIKNMEVL